MQLSRLSECWRAMVVFSVTFLCFAENVALATISKSDYQTQIREAVFRYTQSPEASKSGLPFRFACVATRLSQEWAITAAHCLSGREVELAILCPFGGDAHSVEIARIGAQVSHHTYDVALVRFEMMPPCLVKRLGILRVLPLQGRFMAPNILRGERISQYLPTAVFKELDRDEHTLRLLDHSVCLTQGDSGSPVFVQDSQRIPEIGAILISGTNDCPSIQTAVRLDKIYPWIQHTIRKENLP